MDSISRATVRSPSVICDQIIALNVFCTKQDYLERLRCIRAKDALPALIICALYKSRWQVKVFFQWHQAASSDQTVEQAHAKAPA